MENLSDDADHDDDGDDVEDQDLQEDNEILDNEIEEKKDHCPDCSTYESS
jgi:hypothetical protein